MSLVEKYSNFKNKWSSRGSLFSFMFELPYLMTFPLLIYYEYDTKLISEHHQMLIKLSSLSLAITTLWQYHNFSSFQKNIFFQNNKNFKLKNQLLELSSAIGWSILAYAILESYPYNVFVQTSAFLFILTLSIKKAIEFTKYPKFLVLYYVFLYSLPFIFPLFHSDFSKLYFLLFNVLSISIVNFSVSQHEKNLSSKVNEVEIQQAQLLFYKDILESVPGLVSIFDENLRYQLINSEVTKFTGLPEHQIIGHQLGFAQCSNFEKLIIEFKNSNKNTHTTRLRINGHNGERWFHIALNKLKSENNSNHFIVISIDIHDQVLTEEVALEQRAKVENSSRMATIGELSAGIAHEINNPLAIITSKAEQLIRKMKKQNHIEYLADAEKIKDTSFRIAKIVKGLKNLSRQGEKDPFIKTSLDDIMKDVTVLFEEKFKNKNINLSFDYPKDLSFQCRPVQISQIIINLLGNSMDAISNNPDPWIKFKAEDLNGTIEISVTDCGNGIPLDIQQKLMTPFFTTKPAGVGTGLGLSISKRIMAEHSGEFLLDNNSPNTRFVLRLPKAQLLQKTDDSKKVA